MFLSHIPRNTRPKNKIPNSKNVISSSRTETQTDGRADTKLTTMGTLSGFHDFFPSTYHQGSAQFINMSMFHCPSQSINKRIHIQSYILFQAECDLDLNPRLAAVMDYIERTWIGTNAIWLRYRNTLYIGKYISINCLNSYLPIVIFF